LVFGRRAGEAASEAARSAPDVDELSTEFIDESIEAMYAPFERADGEDPNRLHEELQTTMSSLVGIFRLESDLIEAIERIDRYKERWPGLKVTGPRRFNPAWDLVFELRNMLTVSGAIARSALERTESRGAHSRLDHVGMGDEWSVVNVATRRDDTDMSVRQTPIAELPAELAELVVTKA
jgi:succinate dehydrogenase / fumarate reductase flavoprotein subunit